MDLLEIPKPPGNFILANAKGIATENGQYYHYSELCTLLDKYGHHLARVKAIEKTEYILCAAVWYQDGKIRECQPENITSGVVISGRRHNICITILESFLGSDYAPEKSVVGFITSRDRFLNRREAFIVAKDQYQLTHNMTDMSNPILVSEDLY